MIYSKVPPRSNSGGRPGTSWSTLFPTPAGPPGPANGAASALWTGSLFRPPSASGTIIAASGFCLPPTLAALNQWIVWRLARRRGSDVPFKMPISAKTLRAASSTDPDTWSSLRLAQAALATKCFTGLGFVFAQQGNLFGIDLDNCLSPAGELAPWARGILEEFRTYAEISPSGRGVKLYGIGEHNAKGVSAFMSTAIAGEKRPRVEVYGWGRYFAFTGRRLASAPADVADCRGPLAALVKRLAATPPPPMPTRTPTTNVAQRASLYLARVPPTKCGTASCHNRTFFCACRLVGFFRLSPAEAMPLLADWCSRGEHAWSYTELRHKLSDAARKGHPG